MMVLASAVELLTPLLVSTVSGVSELLSPLPMVLVADAAIAIPSVECLLQSVGFDCEKKTIQI